MAVIRNNKQKNLGTSLGLKFKKIKIKAIDSIFVGHGEHLLSYAL